MTSISNRMCTTFTVNVMNINALYLDQPMNWLTKQGRTLSIYLGTNHVFAWCVKQVNKQLVSHQDTINRCPNKPWIPWPRLHLGSDLYDSVITCSLASLQPFFPILHTTYCPWVALAPFLKKRANAGSPARLALPCSARGMPAVHLPE